MNTRSLAEPRSLAQWVPDLAFGFENLASHKLRSLLTMLGMIFGVAAVVAMLSIGAGAQQKVMAFIEQLGDRKSTRLNSSHSQISYAVFCLKKKRNPLQPAGLLGAQALPASSRPRWRTSQADAHSLTIGTE